MSVKKTFHIVKVAVVFGNNLNNLPIFAHEAYGHLYFKLLGRRHSHGGKRSLSDDSLQNNKELEIQIYNRENEARKHFDMHSDTYTKFLQ